MATMKESLLMQAETMAEVSREMPAEVKRAVEMVGSNFSKIYIIGSGTSLNAAKTALYAFEHYTAAEVRTVAPFDFLHYFPLERLKEDTLVLGISQTARSIGTIECIKLARSKGAKTIFVTAEPENPGAQSADGIFNTWTGLELVGAKTRGFTSTIAALYALAAGLGKENLDLCPLVGAMADTLKETEREIEGWVQELLTAESLTLISYGPTMGIAAEGALKITETVRIPVEYYDVEEYMHGPYHKLTDKSNMVFICPPGAGQARAKQLIEFAGKITTHIYLLADAPLSHNFKGLKMVMPALGNEMLDCINYIIPLQWLANDITLRLGRQPEKSAYPEFHKILGSKYMPKINYYTGEEA